MLTNKRKGKTKGKLGAIVFPRPTQVDSSMENSAHETRESFNYVSTSLTLDFF